MKIPQNQAQLFVAKACKLSAALECTTDIHALPIVQTLGSVEHVECRPTCSLLAVHEYYSKPQMCPSVVAYCTDLLG